MLPNRVRHYFAGCYLETVNPRLKDSPHRQLASMVHGGEGDILEVCAATAFLSRIVATSLPQARIVALDLCPELIAEGRRRARGLHNLQFIRADATAMPYADSSFDVVLVAFGLSELAWVDRGECVGEVNRVLTRRGRFLVVDIDAPSHSGGLFRVYRRLSRRRRAAEVVGNGLSRQIESRGFMVVGHLTGQGRLLPFQVIIAHKANAGADV
jgi:ubiquinone/menaquinone biosynthesis C-methylase UbiE